MFIARGSECLLIRRFLLFLALFLFLLLLRRRLSLRLLTCRRRCSSLRRRSRPLLRGLLRTFSRRRRCPRSRSFGFRPSSLRTIIRRCRVRTFIARRRFRRPVRLIVGRIRPVVRLCRRWPIRLGRWLRWSSRLRPVVWRRPSLLRRRRTIRPRLVRLRTILLCRRRTITWRRISSPRAFILVLLIRRTIHLVIRRLGVCRLGVRRLIIHRTTIRGLIIRLPTRLSRPRSILLVPRAVGMPRSRRCRFSRR